MEISIQLRHLTHSENLVLQMEDWANNFFKIKDSRNLKINVYMDKHSGNLNIFDKKFECHMTADAPWLHKKLFVKSTDSDFWSSYISCSKKLILKMQKDIKKFESSKIKLIRMESRKEWKENLEKF